MEDNSIHLSIDDLNDRQYEIFSKINDTPSSVTKFHVIRSSRQSGKTFLILRLCILFALDKSHQKGAFISASWKQFKKVWDEFLELVPTDFIAEKVAGQDLIKFNNGSSIQFFTGQNYNSIVGNSFDFLVADEVALYPTNSLGIITPVLDAKKESKAVFASTPRGKNDFYQYCMAGMDTKDTFIQHYMMSYKDNPAYDVRTVEMKRKTMVDSIFRSEYLAEFVFGSSSVFGEFKESQTVTEWEEPIPNERYYAGVDVSGDGEDSTILTILNSKGKVAYIHEAESDSIPAQATELAPIINKYNDAITKVEKNGLGYGLVGSLQLLCQNVSSFWTSNDSKNDLVSRAKIALANKTAQLPTADLFPKLDNEMSTYIVIRTKTGLLSYNAETPFHDDTVMSWLISNYVREENEYGSSTTIHNETRDLPSTPSPMDLQAYHNGEYDDEY